MKIERQLEIILHIEDICKNNEHQRPKAVRALSDLLSSNYFKKTFSSKVEELIGQYPSEIKTIPKDWKYFDLKANYYRGLIDELLNFYNDKELSVKLTSNELGGHSVVARKSSWFIPIKNLSFFLRTDLVNENNKLYYQSGISKGSWTDTSAIFILGALITSPVAIISIPILGKMLFTRLKLSRDVKKLIRNYCKSNAD